MMDRARRARRAAKRTGKESPVYGMRIYAGLEGTDFENNLEDTDRFGQSEDKRESRDNIRLGRIEGKFEMQF